MRISIITAVRNGAEGLEQTILSVLSQDYADLEYIIIDGGSTDGTLQIIRKYESLLSHWSSEPDRGISDAFNKGITLATGDIVGITSADDYLMPGALEAVHKAFSSSPVPDVIYGDAVYEEKDNGARFIVRPDRTMRNVWRRQPLRHASTFVNRKTYLKLGAFDLSYRYAMDYELILRFFVRGASFKYIDQPLAGIRSGGVSTQTPRKTVAEVRRISMNYGYSPFKASFFYLLKSVKLTLRQLLQRPPFFVFLNSYRRRSTRFSDFPYQSN